jgi:putative addiction module component (TIGR02574 family)
MIRRALVSRFTVVDCWYNEIMAPMDLLTEARRLPVTERLALIDQLIESVESDATEPLSSEMVSELERRHQAYQAQPDDVEPWEVVRERIRGSLNAARDRRPA